MGEWHEGSWQQGQGTPPPYHQPAPPHHHEPAPPPQPVYPSYPQQYPPHYPQSPQQPGTPPYPPGYGYLPAMPPPPQQQGPWKYRRGFCGLSFGLIATLAVLAVLVPIVLVCGSLGSAFQQGAVAVSTQNAIDATATAAPTLAPQGPLQVGGTWRYHAVDCTLVSVKVISGDGFFNPKAGNEFIVVRIALANNSTDTVSYSDFDFHVLTGSGNITDAELPPSTYTANRELGSGSLASGGTVSGDIILEAPIRDHQAKLIWQPGFYTGTDIAWVLGL